MHYVRPGNQRAISRLVAFTSFENHPQRRLWLNLQAKGRVLCLSQ